jgi:hypothetical protein
MQVVRLIGFMLVVGTAVAAGGQQPDVTEAQKRHFLKFVPKLANDGEFLTEKGVSKAARYTPVLFALTVSDLEDYDIYPFLAVSRGLADRKDTREYAVRHFRDIAHPTIKLFWAAVLFMDYGTAGDVVDYLLAALDSESQSSTLAEMVGPEYEQFKAEVLSMRP